MGTRHYTVYGEGEKIIGDRKTPKAMRDRAQDKELA